MKYGLITFKETENIGDDIQSYSAKRFLPKIDYYVEREELDLFVPSKKEKVITIMNGWFLHSKINAIPSPYIYPVFISSHFSSYDSKGISTEYINDYLYEQLHKYEPTGCRDHQSMKLLSKVGLQSYFSGCMTLTINKFKDIKKENYICMVDIDKRAEEYLEENFKEEKFIKKTHTLNRKKNEKLSWDERFENVEKLLKTYQKAKLVVTSRLHCALPCLALGTPVLLLYDENKIYTKDRLSEYTKYLNHMSTEEFLVSGAEKIRNGIVNSNKYKTTRTNLEKLINDKLEQSTKTVSTKELPNLDDFNKLYVLPKRNSDSLHNVAVNKLYTEKRDYENLYYEKEYWKKEFDILLEKYTQLREDFEKKKEVKNKIYPFIRRK